MIGLDEIHQFGLEIVGCKLSPEIFDQIEGFFLVIIHLMVFLFGAFRLFFVHILQVLWEINVVFDTLNVGIESGKQYLILLGLN